jgi:hypothetical protein
MPGLVIGSSLSFVGEAWIGASDSGTTVVNTDLSATGSCVVSFVGSSKATVDFNSVGTGTATFVATYIVETVFSAAGVGSFDGVGADGQNTPADFTAAGTGTATFVSGAVAGVALNAVGIGAATFVSGAVAGTVLTAQGAAFCFFIGEDGANPSAGHWNFATARRILSFDPTPPEFEFGYRYQLPAELLKIVEFNGSGVATNSDTVWPYAWTSRYVIEGRFLLTNDNEVRIVYIQDVTNPDLWDSMFYQAAASWLASKLAAAIQKSEKMAQTKLEEAMRVFLPLAMAVDGQEGTELPSTIDNLIRVR